MIRVSVAVLAAMMVIGRDTAALAGDAEDCANAGALLKTDRARAWSACHRLAEQGDAHAQYNLGVMYETGQGVAQDHAEAVRWYRRAADQGDAMAQQNLGAMYDNGWGVALDKAAAVTWYRRAADQGDPRAQNDLCVMYATGEGVPQNYVSAYMWCNLAASKLEGDKRELAVRNRALAAGNLTPAQIEEAQRLAREWKPKVEAK